MAKNEIIEVNNFEDKQYLKTIADTVAKGATPSEFAFFIEYCKSTGLNPIKKEIWFIKTSRGLQIMTGINGFLAIANKNPNFDGITTEAIEKNGKLDRIVASVWRKDRSHPSQGTAILSEYKLNTPLWTSKPFTMLEKVAKARALREAFSQELNGIYSNDEFDEKSNAVEVSPEVSPAPEKKKANEIIKTYTYNLALIEDKEKREKIIKYLADNGGEIIYTTDGKILYESDREYSKLSYCLIKPFEDLSADELFDSIDSGEVKNDN